MGRGCFRTVSRTVDVLTKLGKTMETYNTVEIVNAMSWGHSVEKEESARKKQARHLQDKYGKKSKPIPTNGGE